MGGRATPHSGSNPAAAFGTAEIKCISQQIARISNLWESPLLACRLEAGASKVVKSNLIGTNIENHLHAVQASENP